MSTTQAGKPVPFWKGLVVALRRKDAEPTAISIAAEGFTPSAAGVVSTDLIIVDGAGRMLVDQNGDFIVSRRGSTI